MSNSKTIWATLGGVLSSFLAFIGIIGCCGLPILAGVLSFLGIGASQLTFFAQYRWWFIGFAILSLAFGFWQVYFRKPKGNCCTTSEETTESCCSPKSEEKSTCCGGETDKPKQSKSQLFQKIFLWAGAIIILMMLLVGLEEKQTTPADGDCCPAQTEAVQPSSCCPSQPETTQQPATCCPSN